jgi:hypothetical protein
LEGRPWHFWGVGGLVHLGDRAVLPVAWADLGGPDLYPVRQSVLEVAPPDDSGAAPTLLRLLGRYRAPLEAVSVTTFLLDLAGRLELGALTEIPC